MTSPSNIQSKAGLALGIALVLSACGGSADDSTSETASAGTQGAAISTLQTTDDPNVDTLELVEDVATTPDERVSSAVDSLAQSGAYSFKATVSLTVQGSKIETELEGWVDGDDRQITLKADGAEVTTMVIDGTATVERDGQVTEVPLIQATDAPSLEILSSLRNMAFSNGAVTGKLNGGDLTELGYEVNGSAVATIHFGSDGTLSGYEITGANDAWSVVVSFGDL